MKYLLIGFIKLWRLLISPLYGNVCRYYPSCSQYGLDSVRVHGAARGSWLIVRRLTRCTPWHAGGYDPVPGTPEAAEWEEEKARLAAEKVAFAQSETPAATTSTNVDDAVNSGASDDDAPEVDPISPAGHTGPARPTDRITTRGKN